jgi:hypothetical protein
MRSGTLLGTLLLCAGATAATAAGSPETRNLGLIVSGVAWTRAPSVADVAAAYPDAARAHKASGRVTLDCAFTQAGDLADCEPLTEEPHGYGFGRAAQALAAKFAAPATDAEGRPIAGMHTEVHFDFEPTALDAAEAPIGKPAWVALPGPEDFTAAFPAAASKAGVLQARVVLACSVGAAGVLAGCRTLSEEPSGYGFGQGAEQLSGKFRVAVWSDGRPTIGGTLKVPIRYDLKQAQQPEAAKP